MYCDDFFGMILDNFLVFIREKGIYVEEKIIFRNIEKISFEYYYFEVL